MHRSIFFWMLGVLALGGAVLWGVQWYGNVSKTWAQDGFQPEEILTVPEVSRQDVSSQLQSIDKQVAAAIRTWSDSGFDLGITRQLDDAANATIAAEVRTSPAELWQQLRTEGSQAVMQSLAKNTEVTVNDVSTEVMEEARYQYCLGVIEAREQLNATQR